MLAQELGHHLEGRSRAIWRGMAGFWVLWKQHAAMALMRMSQQMAAHAHSHERLNVVSISALNNCAHSPFVS